ncbi:MAG: methionyl-tRNA formyltransferase [Flavobacteriales bacterium]|nr:methionyl-tRNA formyltransferase [Flavobacteriales bacterium]
MARIVFMGTPEFAVASLDALHQDGSNIAAVVTAPDRRSGRGQRVSKSAVKVRAEELGIPILQPTNLKDPEFVHTLAGFHADLFVVVAFRMLPEVVWSLPRIGTLNLHASLLPDLRGAAPINWSIIHGYERTGVTTFLIDDRIDTGDVLLQEAVSIGPEMTAGELHDVLMSIGAGLLVRTVHGLLEGSIQRKPQATHGVESLRPAPKLHPEDGRIDWRRGIHPVHDLIRGLSPYPGAWVEWSLDGNVSRMKVLQARYADGPSPDGPGEIRQFDERMLVSCLDGWIELMTVQLEGRRAMSVGELVRGSRIDWNRAKAIGPNG